MSLLCTYCTKMHNIFIANVSIFSPINTENNFFLRIFFLRISLLFEIIEVLMTFLIIVHIFVFF